MRLRPQPHLFTFDDTCSGDLVFLTGSVRLTTVLAIAAGATLNIRKSHRFQNPLTGAIIFSEPLPTVALGVATTSIIPLDFVDVLNNIDEEVIYTLTISATAAIATTLTISTTFTGAEYR
ncbi:hypothetical protein ACN6MY_14585 [Peribacillus sp. B-H-3]|uniref:hypothetical protein n=1 Tax=Peribacillus sp. B-H-3 TaxID=3400420 RepID=UPI003B016FB2